MARPTTSWKLVAARAFVLVGGLAISSVARAEPPNVQVSAGYDDTCVRKVDGTAWCWGFDGLGELGDGMTTDSSSPVSAMTVGTGVVEVSTGQNHTCARKGDGTLWCWGYDADGELGDGTMNGSSPPEQVAALGTAVAQVSTGYFHTCARKTDGTLWCWGKNDSGQLGDGTAITRDSPVLVAGLGSSVAAVSAGNDHTCALENDGTVWCWGGNGLGQLGDGTANDRATPAAVQGLGGPAAEVSANNLFTCARRTDGTLWCWGGNTDGELGNGTQNNSTTPVQVTALGNSVAGHGGPPAFSFGVPDGHSTLARSSTQSKTTVVSNGRPSSVGSSRVTSRVQLTP